MNQSSTCTSNSFKHSVINFCKHIAGTSKLLAIGIVDNHSIKVSGLKTLMEIIVVIHDFKPRIMSYLKSFDEKTIMIIAVDQWVFERDIERGFLGESIACKLIFPHTALCGSDYLHEKEIFLKKRLIIEVFENLVQSFPELAYNFYIKPQYFMYEIMLNRVKVFPLIAASVSNLMKNGKLQNESDALQSYLIALNQLEKEKIISFSNDYVVISKKFFVGCQNPKVKIINISKNVPRTIFSSLFGVLPQMINFAQNAQNVEFLRMQKYLGNLEYQATQFIDPQKYVFFHTANGLVSLADRIDIEGFSRKIFLKKYGKIKIEPIGGVLNNVYLIKTNKEGEKKILVKCFKDWSGFKWFPLSLWSFGAKTFALSSQDRLAKECATNEFLRFEGFHVPKILSVSSAERLVFMEFIEGENLSQAIKRIDIASSREKTDKDLYKIKQAGELLAKVHSYDMTLGDTKPENMLVKPNGTIYLIDFEQATQNGDKSWDIAVFLYFAGHYLQPFSNNGKASAIAQAFISGYLRNGGNLNDVKKVADAKYTRVFSIFTMPSIIKEIMDTCKKAS